MSIAAAERAPAKAPCRSTTKRSIGCASTAVTWARASRRGRHARRGRVAVRVVAALCGLGSFAVAPLAPATPAQGYAMQARPRTRVAWLGTGCWSATLTPGMAVAVPRVLPSLACRHPRRPIWSAMSSYSSTVSRSGREVGPAPERPRRSAPRLGRWEPLLLLGECQRRTAPQRGGRANRQRERQVVEETD